ncbi:probable tubulin polyglutamylase TTLL2 [Limanda limanda]|uniref:probable tubulin polyglutamylase TTLL2 n=1 Tax=Limanda limanda TaxID=27771 RepID=UPI0029C93A98|nr:probable tubulin polyglutamylase TTLL2 [Limanda limanda]
MAASLVFRLHDKAPELLRDVLLERGWEEYDGGEREEEDWNLYWRGSAFRSSQYHNLLPWQRLNHHPKTVGITRKDCLARNLRRMRASWGSSLYDFSPSSFILPNDYTRFLAEYDKLHLAGGASLYWICKPVDLSRGRGIFLFQDIKDLVYDCSVIVQRYVSNPLLISGYKFDLRIYVCVNSFHPLTVYIHQEGLVRFATEKYSLSSLGNLFAHLTNSSINKLGPFYRAEKERVGRGCKWTMSKFRHFLRSQDVDELPLWQRISSIVTLTLLAIAPSVPSCPNCLELFGFDILVDAGLKPWLLEVNCSPALSLDCPADVSVKRGLISDLIDLMNYTSTDGLRDGAFQKRKHQQPCFHGDRPSYDPRSSQTQTLPLLKAVPRSKGTNPGRRALVADRSRRLPPVYSNRACAAGVRKINSTAGTTHSDQTLHLILGSRSRTNASVVKRHERPGETDVSQRTPGIRQRGLGFKPSAVAWKLPNIYSGSRIPVTAPLVETTAPNGRDVPPVRVGDFIRTFPFNAATLKASRHKLNVKVVVRELHKLTGQVTSGRSHEAEGTRKSEEDFDSLLWGPKDPPSLRQCFKPN